MTQAEHHTIAETIAALARDAAPVRVLAPPAVRLSRWIAAAVALALLVVAQLGVRPNLAMRVGDPSYGLNAAILAALAVAAAACALLHAVPGAPRVRETRAMTMALAVLWVAVVIWPLLRETAVWPAGWANLVHLTCAFRIAAVGALPAIVLFAMVRAAAPLQLQWAAGSVGLGAVALGALGTQMVCMDDAAVHLLSWHLVPGMLATGATTWIGARLLR